MISIYSKIVTTVSHPNKHLPSVPQLEPVITQAVAPLKPLIHPIWLSEVKYGKFSWEKKKGINFLLAHSTDL